MEENKDIISMNQMISILTMAAVSTGILTLPRNLAEEVPHDHWIVVLAAGLVALLVVVIYAWIIKLNPGKHYYDILCDSLSKPLAYMIFIVYLVYFIGLIGLLTRLFGEIIKVYLLVRTPIEVINVSILISCIYLSRKGVEVAGRLSTFLFPATVTVTVLLFILSFTKTNFRNLLPVFQISFSEIFQSIPITILSFLGLEVALFFGFSLDKPKESMKITISVAIVSLFYLLVIVSTFAKFGPIQMKTLVWPTLSLFDTVEIPGFFIENVQVLVMSTWVIAVFTTLAPLYLAGVITAKAVMGFRDQASLVVPFLPLIYFASLIPKNLAHLYKIVDVFTQYFASIMVAGIPLIVLISLLIQAKLGREGR